MTQTLEEKAVMVAKALCSRESIYCDGERYAVDSIYWHPGSVHVRLINDSRMPRNVCLDLIDPSLTPPAPEFKPCPFCGGAVKAYINPGCIDDDVWDIGCTKCTARLLCFASESDAMAAWNRRKS